MSLLKRYAFIKNFKFVTDILKLGFVSVIMQSKLCNLDAELGK